MRGWCDGRSGVQHSRACTLVSWSSVVRMGMPSALMISTPCTPGLTAKRLRKQAVRGLRLWSLHCSTATGWLEETGATRAAATLLTGVGADALERLLNLRGRLAEWVWGASQHRTAVQAHDRGRARTHHVSTRYQADSQLERHGAEVVRLAYKWCSSTVDASGG